MRLSLRNTIILNFILIIIILVIFGSILGVFLIDRTTVDEEQRRVSVDLKSAWSVLEGKFSELTVLVNVLGSGKRVAGAFQEPIDESSRVSLEVVRRNFNLDFLTLTNRDGQVIMRAAAPYRSGDDLSNDMVIQGALKGKTVQGFQIFPAERLQAEGGDLPERAFTVFELTTKAKARAKTTEDAGLVKPDQIQSRGRTAIGYIDLCPLPRQHSNIKWLFIAGGDNHGYHDNSVNGGHQPQGQGPGSEDFQPPPFPIR